jgi:hypothetical protein
VEGVKEGQAALAAEFAELANPLEQKEKGGQDGDEGAQRQSKGQGHDFQWSGRPK